MRGELSLSIHWNKTFYGGDWRKKNTCKPRSARPLASALAGINRHINQHPNDAAAITRRENLKRRLSAIPTSIRNAA